MNMREIISIVAPALMEAMAAPDTAQFKAWFAGSKVADRTGHPLFCYHGSTQPSEVNLFKPFTHFGTVKAANDRLSDLATGGGHVYPVFLKIVKPLIMPDCGGYIDGRWDREQMLDFMVRKRVTSRKIANEVARRERCNGSAWTFIKELGYDGVQYRNTEEDKGSISWVITRSDQVWPAFDTEPDP